MGKKRRGLAWVGWVCMCIGEGDVGALGFQWCKEVSFLGEVEGLQVLI